MPTPAGPPLMPGSTSAVRAGRSPRGRIPFPHGRDRCRRPVPGQRHAGRSTQCLRPLLPTGNPTSASAKDLAWPKGAIEQTVDLALPRGVLIRGKVTEEGTGQPVADAMVIFYPSAPRAARAGAADGP